MNWLELILTHLASVIVGTGGAVLFFRPKLKEAKASALKAQTDAQDYVYNSLIARINQMEKSYNEQYAEQNKVIADLRTEVIALTKEKFTSEKRMVQLESENSALRERVDSLEKEVQAYRTITKKSK